MRLLVLLSVLLVPMALLHAQAPEAFQYQAVARDAGGDALTNTAIGVQFQLHQGTAVGTVVYAETLSPTTNANGLFSVEVGHGTPTTGTFSAIDWSAGPYFLEVGLDPVGGSSYTSLGTQQLLSVPYALHAGSVDMADDGDWVSSGDTLHSNGRRVGVGTSSPEGMLDVAGMLRVTTDDGRLDLQRTTGANYIDFNSGNPLHFRSIDATDANGAVRMSLLNTGRLGIGTTSPQSQLDLRDAFSSELRASLSNTHWAKFQFTIWEGLRIEAKNEGVEFRPVLLIGKELRFLSGTDTTPERMRISSSGNVGIGTTSPSSKLYVKLNAAPSDTLLLRTGLFLDNGDQTGTFPDDPNDVALVFGENGTPKQAIIGATYANDHLRFYTGEHFDTAKVSIDHDGRVGIGTESPSARLDVVGTFQLQDGNEGTGKVLTSDAYGNASWANSPSLPNGSQPGDMLYWNGSSWVTVPAGPPSLYGPDAPTLRFCNGVPTWGTCTVPLGAMVSGGIVFYVDGTGEHGLIAKLTDDADAMWGCDGFSTSTSAAVGEGANNRINYDIALQQATQAAQSAYQVSLSQHQSCCSQAGQNYQNGGCAACGYAMYDDPCPYGEGAIGQTGDWYMPSIGELDLIYTNLYLNGLGGLANQAYWSSTQYSQANGDAIAFSNGNHFNAVKTANYRVRRIKAF